MVQEDVLYGQRNLTVFRTLHQREPAMFLSYLLAVAIDDVAEFLITANDVAFIHPCTYLFTDAPPFITNATIFFQKEPLVVGTIHNSKGGTSM